MVVPTCADSVSEGNNRYQLHIGLGKITLDLKHFALRPLEEGSRRVQDIGGETTLFGRTLRKFLNHHQRASFFLGEAPLAHGSPDAAKGVEHCLDSSVTRSRSALSSPSHRKAGHLDQARLEGWLMVSVNSMTSPNTFVPAFTGQSAAPVLFALRGS